MQSISDRKLAMAQWIVVDFVLPHDGGDTSHRIGNWADDLWALLQEDPGAFVPLADDRRPTDKLSVAVVHARDLKRIRTQIEKVLEAHNLAGVARVRVDPPKP